MAPEEQTPKGKDSTKTDNGKLAASAEMEVVEHEHGGSPYVAFTPAKTASNTDDDPYIIDYVLNKWKQADKDNSGRLSLHEVMKLLNALNITMKESVVKDKFKKVDKDSSGELDFSEFRHFLEDLRTRPEIKQVFEQYSANKHYLTEEEFVLFLKQEQYELAADVKNASKLIQTFEHSETANRLYFTGFSEYIVSQENSAYSISHRAAVYQSMDHPLPHYYVASSHNTYLEGDQLKGNSSVDAYIHALKQGCRCVELDCWDGDDGYPIIYHGHTMTSKIKFRDVIQAVKDFGFVASPYPVILSLENHCSIEQQVRMAEILVDILGDVLPKCFKAEQTRPLPSPEQLKNKVLIKGKMAPSSQEEKSSEDDEDDDDEDDEEEEQDPEDTPIPVVVQIKSSKGIEKKEEKKKPVKITTAKELSDLVHLKSVHFGGFQNAKDKNAPWEISSFSELKVKKLVKTDNANSILLNMEQTSRVYPKGTRFDSSNYMPINAWLGGFQLVALNYQTKDLSMRLNIGKFLDNGNCGYVLKPTPLRTTANLDVSKISRTLHVRLISGWQLPKESGTNKGEVIDPYVKIRIFGAAEDQKKYKSKVIQNNGFNPSWDEKCSFALSRPDLAEIIFEIYDQDKLSKDDFIGFSAIPIASLKAGTRSVHLYDPKSVPLPDSSLLVQFSFE